MIMGIGRTNSTPGVVLSDYRIDLPTCVLVVAVPKTVFNWYRIANW